MEGFQASPWTETSFGYECKATNLRIDYVVSGDNRSKVQRLKLLFDLNYVSGDRAERIAEFDRIATLLLARLGLKASRGLHAAIHTTRQFREAQTGANITFDPGRRPYSVQTLIIRDSAVRVVPIPRYP